MNGLLLKIDSTVYIVPNEALVIILIWTLFVGALCLYVGTLRK